MPWSKAPGGQHTCKTPSDRQVKWRRGRTGNRWICATCGQEWELHFRAPDPRFDPFPVWMLPEP